MEGQLLLDSDQESDDNVSQNFSIPDQLPACPLSPASINSEVFEPTQQDSNLSCLQSCDKNTVAKCDENINGLKECGCDTLNTDKNKDIYIRNGDILIGDEAIAAKHFRDIQEIERRHTRRFTVTLKHPDSCGSSLSGDLNDPDDNTHHESDSNSVDENTGHLRHNSLSVRSDEEQNMNSLRVGEDSPLLTEKLDKEDLQSGAESDVYSSMNDINSHSCEDSDEDDKTNQCIEMDTDSHSLYTDFDNESTDCHIGLVQDSIDSEEESGNTNIVIETDSDGEYSDIEEGVDAHRSVKQTSKKVKITVNEHTRSTVASSKEVLKQTSTKSVSEVKVASTDGKLVNEKVQCLTSETKLTGGDICVATANTKLVNTKVQTGSAVTKIEGAELKVASADMKGLNVQAGAVLNTTTKVSTTTAASVELTGANVDAQITAEPTAQGLSSKAGTATIMGVQEKVKASAKVTSSGAKVQAGVANITGVKSGVTAEASAEAAGLDVNVGTCQLSGVELSATASASASVGTELNIANARVSGFDGVGARASVKAKSGLELFNANMGISGNVSVNVSTTPKVCCITIAPGPPKIGIGAGFLNFGFGGGIEGESGRYAGVATVGDPNGSSNHGNEYGGSGGVSGGHGSDSVSGGHGSDSVSGGHGSGTGHFVAENCISSPSTGSVHVQPGVVNSSGILPLSTLQGSTKGLPGSLHITGSTSGQVLSGNGISVDGHRPSVGTNNALDIHTKSQDVVRHNENNGAIRNGNALCVDLSKQPLHLKGLHALEQQHLSKGTDKQKKMQLRYGQASGPASETMLGQQVAPLSGIQANGHIQISGQLSLDDNSEPLGAGAKLQAMINEHYPLLPGENKCDSVASKTSQQCSSEWDIERVKKSAISRLSKQGNAEVQGSGSTTPSNFTADNQTVKRKDKPFGSRNHIHTLGCIVDRSSKDVVQINSGSGKIIAGFKDRDN